MSSKYDDARMAIFPFKSASKGTMTIEHAVPGFASVGLSIIGGQAKVPFA